MTGDFTGAHQVALVTHEDDGSLWLSLPQEKSQLSGAMETAPVGHRKHQDANLTLQRRQVLQRRQRRDGPTHATRCVPVHVFSGFFLREDQCLWVKGQQERMG